MPPLPHPADPAGRRLHGRRRGATLIEVLWACVILAVIAIAAGSFVSLSSGLVSVTRNHRIAVEAANSRLEDIRASGFDAVKPSTQTYATNYISRSGSSWQVSTTNPNESLWIQGRNYPIITTVQYVDIDGGSATYDVLRINVSVLYRQNEPNRVQLWAYMGP